MATARCSVMPPSLYGGDPPRPWNRFGAGPVAIPHPRPTQSSVGVALVSRGTRRGGRFRPLDPTFCDDGRGTLAATGLLGSALGPPTSPGVDDGFVVGHPATDRPLVLQAAKRCHLFGRQLAPTCPHPGARLLRPPDQTARFMRASRLWNLGSSKYGSKTTSRVIRVRKASRCRQATSSPSNISSTLPAAAW